jgi:sulfite reductase (NADPH) flavoprotein alpha-component
MSALAADSVALPLAEDQMLRIEHALVGLTPGQLQWLSGYIAGLGASPAPLTEPVPERSLTILYGSQTGNSEDVASVLVTRVAERGLRATLCSLANYEPRNLKRESFVAFVISTHGEGEPPDDAELFHDFLFSARAPRLPDLRYAVLALGDRSYVNFCRTGREFDARLEELGAQRLLPLLECDLDFEQAAETWRRDIVDGLPNWVDCGPVTPQLRAVETTQYGKGNPFSAFLLANQKITGRESTKDVRHIELSLEGSGLAWEPGDSLAIAAVNPPELIRQFFEFLETDANREVSIGGDTITLGDALAHRLEITAANPGFIRKWSEFSGHPALEGLLADGRQRALAEYLDTHQIIDIVREYPAEIGADQFIPLLRKLGPRSYSIASSYHANPDEVHLTVAAVRYEAFGQKHWGAASTHIADRVVEGGALSVYVNANSRFRLPEDDTTDIIMIGPGTGVAPFRAFIEERTERAAQGRNWLFFGDRNFSSDFLYQLEWQKHLKQGGLHRLDVAFSRDQGRKIYVQDRIRENAGEIYRWMKEGAYVYVCGDAKYMAVAVNEALIDVIATEAGVECEAAEAELKSLGRDGRFRRDVY